MINGDGWLSIDCFNIAFLQIIITIVIFRKWWSFGYHVDYFTVQNQKQYFLVNYLLFSCFILHLIWIIESIECILFQISFISWFSLIFHLLHNFTTEIHVNLWNNIHFILFLEQHFPLNFISPWISDWKPLSW